MARGRRKRKTTPGFIKTDPIVIALSSAIKTRLKRKGRFSNKRVVRLVRVVYANGKFTITSHKKGPKFVASNSCFA